MNHAKLQASPRTWVGSTFPVLLGSGLLCSMLTTGLGCSSFASLQGIPAHRVPPALMGERRSDLERIDLMRLRQDPPEVYLLASRDTLGVYVPGVYGSKEEGVPPTHFPDSGKLPPSVGHPTVVREDGTISLPQVAPIKVEGLTITEAELAVRRAYTKVKKIITDSPEQIIVTMMKPRTYQVLVVREDSAGAPFSELTATGRVMANSNTQTSQRALQRGSGSLVDMEAYENDVLRALMLTGGLPKDDAKDEVLILRGGWSDAADRDRLIGKLGASGDPCGACRTRHRDRYANDPNVLRIPLRTNGRNFQDFDQDAILLREGDIVLVESRNRDVFYTGGLLPGGSFVLPREEDTDVLKAISLAGGSIGGGFGSGGGRGGFGGGGVGSLVPPSQAIVVRTIEGCGAFNIRVDLNRALVNPQERVLIQPGDIVILKYTTGEVIANAFLSTVNFNFLFNGLSNRF